MNPDPAIRQSPAASSDRWRRFWHDEELRSFEFRRFALGAVICAAGLAAFWLVQNVFAV